MSAAVRKRKNEPLRGPRIRYGDGAVTPYPDVDVDKILKILEEQSEAVRRSFLGKFAHSLTVDARALFLDLPAENADLEKAAHINAFLHQLTGSINTEQFYADTAGLVRAIVDASTLYDLESAAARALTAAASGMVMRRPNLAIEGAAQSVCEAAAQAVHEFAAISGVSPREHLPESFVVGFVFQRLAGLYSMTLETNLRKVWRWHLDHLGIKNSQRKEDEEVSVLTTELGQQRVDLILYSGDPAKPDETEFLSLVEFKLWTRSLPDRQKMLNVLKRIDSCPNGLLCSVVNDPLEAERAEQEGWYVAPVRHLPHKLGGRYFACTSHFLARQ